MFQRLELLIGEHNLNRLEEKTVLVVGLGGVGGHCVEALVRSAISNLIIIDYDVVDITNLNRQRVATHSTVGKKKVEVMTEMIRDISPKCQVTGYDMFLTEENLSQIFEKHTIDYIVDACDFVKTKKALILECLRRKIKIVSCMGTGNKLDPSKLEVTDIRKTINDPLARIMRKWVKDLKIKDKIMVLSSTEVPKHLGKTVASTSFVPSSAGLLIASYIVRDIIKEDC